MTRRFMLYFDRSLHVSHIRETRNVHISGQREVIRNVVHSTSKPWNNMTLSILTLAISTG